jgi:hypothetical protein
MKLLAAIAVIAVISQLPAGYTRCQGLGSRSDIARTAAPDTAKICSKDGTLNLDEAHRLRDYLGAATTRKEQLVPIDGAIGDAIKQCRMSTSVDASVVGGLWVVLGNRLIVEKEYSRAKRVFQTAEQLFTRFGAPSLMWLAALQGEAQAELMLENTQRADAIAAIQTTMAREWVDKEHFASGALVSALRFEAKIRDAEDQPESATRLMHEADRLESRE